MLLISNTNKYRYKSVIIVATRNRGSVQLGSYSTATIQVQLRSQQLQNNYSTVVRSGNSDSNGGDVDGAHVIVVAIRKSWYLVPCFSFLVALNFANKSVTRDFYGSYYTIPSDATVALRTGSDVAYRKGDKVSSSGIQLGPHQGVVLSWDYVAKEL